MQEEMHRPVPFWHRPGPKIVLPWVTSLVFHATLVALMILLVPPLIKLVNHTPPPAPISTGGMDTQTNMGELPGPSSPELPLLPKPDKNTRPGSDKTPFSPGQRSDTLQQAMRAGLTGDTDSIAVSQDGTIGGVHGNMHGILGSSDDRNQSGHMSLGEPQVGGPMFKDIPGIKLPKSVCYVCDASGSMNNGNKADVLRDALKGAVNALYPVQQFNVFFFQQRQTGQDFLSQSDQLMMAIPANRAKLSDFVDNQVGFHGETNAVPALQEAFKEKPEVIFLLTDGLWEKPGPDGLGMLKLINQLNAGKQVRVNTILLFVDQKDEASNADADQIMEQIAKENGGTFRKCVADKY